jgi:hypothetical protein
MEINIKHYEDMLKEEAKKENGCCYYFLNYLKMILMPFNKLGL